MITPPPPAPGLLTLRPRWVQWLALAVLSVAFATFLELAGFPAALLLGPMIAGIVVGVSGARLEVPSPLLIVAQTIVGCLVVASIAPESLPAFMHNWPLLVAAVLATLVGSSFLGWLISRYQVLPGTVGVWGSAPGAATAMVLMAGAFGADQRLVAFMQYYRVIVVTAVATLIARLWVGHGTVEEMIWFPAIEPVPFLTTLGVAVAGGIFGRLIRLPIPYFVGPMVLGMILKFGVGLDMQLPPWLLALSFGVVGWSVGLRFTRETLIQMRGAMAPVGFAVISLIAFCALIGFVLAEVAGVDPLTAYLATSPGGMDAVAIIAAGSGNVDMSFIMALQMLRFIIVLMTGPWLARQVAKRIKQPD